MALALGPWKATFDPEAQSRIDAMADELCRQAAHLTAAEYRWLRLLGEFDQAGGWAPPGGTLMCGVVVVGVRRQPRGGPGTGARGPRVARSAAGVFVLWRRPLVLLEGASHHTRRDT